jgi:TolA-binding protein
VIGGGSRRRPWGRLAVAVGFSAVALAAGGVWVARSRDRGEAIVAPATGPSVVPAAAPVPVPAAVPVPVPVPAGVLRVPAVPVGVRRPSVDPRPIADPRAIPEPDEPMPAPAAVVDEPMPDPTPAPSAPAERELAEHRMLAETLKRLRDHDGAGALASLERYHERFPRGTLAPEAELLRVDALLLVGRRREALPILDGRVLAESPRARELGVVRGELRAEAGRCAEAARDFGAALVGIDDKLEERARYGRASCRARLGDPAGARDDLAAYLARFPAGRFAAEAREALAK